MEALPQRSMGGGASIISLSKPSRVRRTIWTKQVSHALSWLLAFLTFKFDTMTKVYHLRHHLRPTASVTIATDASPWGLGALLLIDGILVAALFSAITPFDEEKFKLRRGDNEGQQVWELLIVLVALRHWSDRWPFTIFCLEVRSDNMAALVATGSLKASTTNANMIARELALDYGAAAYRPSVVTHTPGICNVIPDWLSRREEPGPRPPPPSALQGITIETPVERSSSYYLADPLPRDSKMRKKELLRQQWRRDAKSRYLRAKLAIAKGRVSSSST